MFKVLSATILCTAIVFLAGTASAQSSCFPHRAFHTTIPLVIKDEPNGEAVARTIAKETYSVSLSKNVGTSCWIEIDEGWVKHIFFVKHGGYEDKPQRTALNDRCFPSTKAYITGTMNIRASASTNSAKAGAAQAGQSYTVALSHKGDAYCWLKISEGWIAKTGRVQSTKPSTTRTVPITRATTVNYSNVQGPPRFNSAVNKALGLLKSRAANWYNYVVSKNPLLRPNNRQFPFTVSFSQPNTGEIWIGSTHDKDTGILAGVLVHETCHVHQWQDGRLSSLGRIEREVECMELQVQAMQQASPGHRFIKKIQDLLNDPRRLYG